MVTNRDKTDDVISNKKLVDKVRNDGSQLPEKKFVMRNSILTDLFENPHIKTVYHIFVATFVGLLVNTLAHDYFVERDVKIGLRLIKAGFRNVHLSFLIWLGYYASTCLCYVAFIAWAKMRIHLPPKSERLRLYDRIWLSALLGYYILSFRTAQRLVTLLDLPPAVCAIVVIEQTRLLMKLHAFVRHNAEMVLNYKVHSDKELKLPTFSHFVYFTFAPTLVYRDDYPRTKYIDWSHVMQCLLECIGIIFYYCFVIERLLNPLFQDFGLRKFTIAELALALVQNAVTGILLLLSTFYLILHSWQNLFAEILRFGDRMFYKEWWRSVTYSEYYRTWNVIVHDWLYTYVYKDMVQIIAPNRRVLAKFTVFLVSAIVHEWILTYMFGFFLPALFIQFFFLGSVMNFVAMPRIGLVNILFWYSLALGTGLIISMYTLEFYARRNIPKPNQTLVDFFIPRFLTCDCIN